MQPSPVFTSPS
jgi:hypothetical protein